MRVPMITTYFSQLNIPISPDKPEKLERYYDLLIKKNKVMNLTTITDHDEFMRKHILDSLAVVRYFSFDGVEKVMDLGTGGGFPGIPLKIFFPETEFTLVDSVNKKLRFIEEAARELGLDKISFVHGRAEDLAHDDLYREKYDVLVSRAVANLSTLTELSLGFIKQGGLFLSYKGVTGEEELKEAAKAINIMGGEPGRLEKYDLPGGDDQRSLIFIKKTKKTPKTYPRKAGVPNKKPL
ncbi:MAG: 16S rRNA (guanine(527)-N(7))-methyltransferase RsmG [Lachnospiraceae bacterium]|nr:16S rRNA (guanine(527)-N(7))-methyltransferase RsmG [Lachnospiraceae bacterium]